MITEITNPAVRIAKMMIRVLLEVSLLLLLLTVVIYYMLIPAVVDSGLRIVKRLPYPHYLKLYYFALEQLFYTWQSLLMRQNN